MTTLIRLLNTLLATFLTGIIFGVWIVNDPQNLSMYAYVEQQQCAIKALNNLMPIIGTLTIITTLFSAILQRKNKTIFIPLLFTAGLFIVTGLVTRLGNQPINAIMMTWDKHHIPSNWTGLRDRWWLLHQIRTATSTGALVIVIWTGLRKD